MFLATLGLPVVGRRAVRRAGSTPCSRTSTWVRTPRRRWSRSRRYFEDAISDRVAHPRDPEADFLSRMLRPDIAGDWLSREDLITVCLSLMIAGLDTTRSALGYAFQHLAAHPGDRAGLVADPALIPKMVEEFVRLYSLILQDGRLVTGDIDFHGLPMKAGDIVWLGVASANRDPRKFDHPDEFDPDRERPRASPRLRRRSASLPRHAPGAARTADRAARVACADPGLPARAGHGADRARRAAEPAHPAVAVARRVADHACRSTSA